VRSWTNPVQVDPFEIVSSAFLTLRLSSHHDLAMPDISVVLPCHNSRIYLADAIESVLRQQDAPSWELLIVDDGSTDGSREIAAAFEAQDSRIRLIALPANQGVSTARNIAIEASDSRYIAFLDADDFWLPSKLSIQTGRMRTSCWRMSFTGYRRFSPATGTLGRIAHIPPVMTYRRLLGNPAMATSTIMIERSLLRAKRFATVLRGHEDFALWLDLLRDGTTAHGLPEDLARYRVVAGSLSSRYSRSAGWVWNIHSRREGLPPLVAAGFFLQYAARAIIKRMR
jgi:teichuronic acid biosynthesis glycosyltransferase TuaG